MHDRKLKWGRRFLLSATRGRRVLLSATRGRRVLLSLGKSPRPKFPSALKEPILPPFAMVLPSILHDPRLQNHPAESSVNCSDEDMK
ncbi:unnamed protein product [Gadus morhua 'NCC']